MTVYKSKFGFIIIIPFTFAMGCVIWMSVSENSLIGLYVASSSFLLLAYFYFTTSYTINYPVLKIKASFLMTINIRIESIKRIAETSNPLSSPAFSLDRLVIYYNNNDRIMISPVHKSEFIKELIVLNPNIEVKLKSTKY